MPRPVSCRHVHGNPTATVFKPTGIPRCALEEVALTLDEFEALRLADLLRMYQEEAALQMGVSRPTFGRILEQAHHKIADALVHGKIVRIGGGAVEQAGHRCCHLHDTSTKAAKGGGPR